MHAYYIAKKLCMHHKLKRVISVSFKIIIEEIKILLFYTE